MKTTRRIVRRPVTAPLRVRRRPPLDPDAFLRVDPSREDIPVEVISLTEPIGLVDGAGRSARAASSSRLSGRRTGGVTP